MRRRGSAASRRAAALAFAAALLVACNNVMTGTTVPVPPVHRVPEDVAGTVILVGEDPIIETKDPVHIERARFHRVPQDYRAAMVKALVLAGFKVTERVGEPHDLVAKLALAVTEDGDEVRQVYRCGLYAPGATPALVAQIDWRWPRGTYVELMDVFDFATHNLATEIATSRRVLAWARGRPRADSAPPPSP